MGFLVRFSLRKSYAVAVTAGVMALAGAVAVVGLTHGDRDVSGAGADGHVEVRLGGRSFRISGDAVKPIAPGRSAAIDVVFTNPRLATLRVTELRVRVREVDAPKATEDRPCSRRDFAVRQVRPSFAVTVPARSSRSLSRVDLRRGAWPRVRMIDRPVNQDGCKGASITLGFRGSGSMRR